ncbi:vomeronasal type-1 receptor 4-like [Gracilinanus agilis]|uniref:vomeronasal type-1 receptor 4-like n=1 Tax=Gracilinanus agilis TaxID=191870 RepID=UPI001CFC5B69|nr:vomeronasal type-1 receptor 4-like [Gracilinanus agilis]
MFPKNTCLAILFLAMTTVGTAANVFLFTFYMFHALAGNKMNSINLIFTQLSLVNFTMLLSKGIPQTLLGLEWNYFLNDVGCKVVFYLRKVSQGLAISFTSLLCLFQAVIIGPPNSRWAEFKSKATKQAVPSYFFSWTLNLLLEIPVSVSVRGPRNGINITNTFDYIYCTFEHDINVYVIMVSFRNVLCLGILVLSGGYMILFLHKHHQHIQNIQNTNLQPKNYPEIKATQTILLLMSTFVTFYALESIFTIFLTYLDKKSNWILSATVFLSLCYPTISPFLLLTPRISRSSCRVMLIKLQDVGPQVAKERAQTFLSVSAGEDIALDADKDLEDTNFPKHLLG